ncbi:serine/threonine protein kinase [Phycicoccus sp. HDW14]|uniref:serine/threonine-protein kinase n=1 Tax=Phycicoccus sp. HDW14 TaxID=2714941 RepID=UPI00140DBCE3|nr:serine/threonine-protein kinase [Phycicoccus sp. HDW14]QIM21505.1 serine/threonine protein kinase [Phycicoccus sp. HDW14]
MGEVFAGRYELLDLIGEGGMGSVWRVWDRREERVVAAKVLRQSDAVSLLRFVREQAVRVRHPHVLTPLGWAGEDDRVLFTMPVVDGGSAASLVGDHGRLPPLLVAELLRQLLSALESVHGAGLVHRDVKPANLLLVATGTGRPHALLTDFGIAVDEDGPRFTRSGAVTGTPGYIAPEVEEGADPAPAVDLYAAGQVARALLTGTRPSDPAAAVLPEGTPPALASAVAALTDPDPTARPASAGAAGDLLADPSLAWTDAALGEVEVLTHVPAPGDGRRQLRVDPVDDLPTRVAAPTIPPPPEADDLSVSASRPGSPRGPRRPLVAVAAAAVLVLGGGLAWWAVGTDGDPDPGTTPTPTASPSRSATPTPSGTPSTSSPSPTPSPSPSTSRGSVQVGTVVVRVGQECSFSDVGLREETIAGEPVVCRQRDDGRYAWDPPGG